MDNHRVVLGALFLGLGLMGLIGMTVIMVVFSIGSAAIGAAAAQDAELPPALALLPTVFGVFLCCMIGLGAIPSLIAGYGLLRDRSWARVWALIAGVLNLPSVPFGTAVGAYALWFFVQDDREPTPAQTGGDAARTMNT